MSWLTRLLPPSVVGAERKKNVPEGLWSKCEICGNALYQEEFEKYLMVCSGCDHHHRMSPEQRAKALFDDMEKVTDIGLEIRPKDFLKFKDTESYSARIKRSSGDDRSREALVVKSGTLDDHPIVAAFFDFSYMGGSMGSVVGERFARAAEEALATQMPMVCFSASGGARMQEGLVSLMQMGKTVSMLHRLDEAKLPFVSVLTHPTTGGVAASFAMLGDVIIAEPGALIGFAGPRVIQQTVREELPEGFQRSEFLLEHGAIDMIVDRRKMRETLSQLLRAMMHSKRGG